MRASLALWYTGITAVLVFAPSAILAEAAPRRDAADTPRFYFPRVIKRQVPVNVTIPKADPAEDEPPKIKPRPKEPTPNLENVLSSIIAPSSSPAREQPSKTLPTDEPEPPAPIAVKPLEPSEQPEQQEPPAEEPLTSDEPSIKPIPQSEVVPLPDLGASASIGASVGPISSAATVDPDLKASPPPILVGVNEAKTPDATSASNTGASSPQTDPVPSETSTPIDDLPLDPLPVNVDPVLDDPPTGSSAAPTNSPSESPQDPTTETPPAKASDPIVDVGPINVDVSASLPAASLPAPSQPAASLPAAPLPAVSPDPGSSVAAPESTEEPKSTDPVIPVPLPIDPSSLPVDKAPLPTDPPKVDEPSPIDPSTLLPVETIAPTASPEPPAKSADPPVVIPSQGSEVPETALPPQTASPPIESPSTPTEGPVVVSPEPSNTDPVDTTLPASATEEPSDTVPVQVDQSASPSLTPAVGSAPASAPVESSAPSVASNSQDLKAEASPASTAGSASTVTPTPDSLANSKQLDSAASSANSVVDASASVTPPPQPAVSKLAADQTAKSIGQNTLSAKPVDPNIVIFQSSSSVSIGAADPSAPTSAAIGIPSSLPKLITPGDGPVPKPANTTLIQVGFEYQLNYRFVVSNTDSTGQIFHYFPIGVAYGLGLDVSQVVMNSLQPYDTTEDLNYITTLALAYIPDQSVEALKVMLYSPASKLYHNIDNSTSTLMSMINPIFPIKAGVKLGEEDGSGPDGFSSATGSSGNDGTTFSGPEGSSSVKGKSIGIGVGVVAGAAAYGAAMFFVARRYKRRRQHHKRSSSVLDHDGAANGALMGGALMSGGRSTPSYHDRSSPETGRDSRNSGRSGGTSARNQQISAPMMAENSLGWN
ncbi:MAG: hypothetical protein M1825_006000 [Sarcosagium campestre]|nr:MAG: hypothetical protein M1825_006000 [Sarcosagium campestre]